LKLVASSVPKDKQESPSGARVFRKKDPQNQ
jgi:hypothetical protein